MPIVLKNRTRNSLPENLHHSVPLIAKDLKIVCDDGVIDSYQAVFAWASSFLRRQFVGKFVMEDSGKRKDDLTMYLPGVSKEIVTALVEILVKGEATNVTNLIKAELQVLWSSLGIDRTEFDKLGTEVNSENNSRIKNLGNTLKTHNEERKTLHVNLNEDDDHVTPVSYKIPQKNRNKLQVKKLKDMMILKTEDCTEVISDPEPEYLDTNKSAIVALDNNKDVPIFVPGYENVINIDEKSLASFESVPVIIDNYQTTFEIPSDISIFPALEDNSCENRKSVSKRKQSEIESYTEQSLKASRIERAPKISSTVGTPKQQDTSRSKNHMNPKPTKLVNPDMEPLACYVCNSTRDKEKRPLNLKNVFYLKNHISKCLYMSGRLFAAIDPGDENRDANGRPVDEFGLKNGFWYRCEIEGCWLQQKKGVHGQVCYKVFAIHMASQHGVVEAVMVEDGNENALELVQKIRDHEERRNQGKLNSKVLQSTSLQEVKMQKANKLEVVTSTTPLELEEAVDDPAPLVNPFTITKVSRQLPHRNKETTSKVDIIGNPQLKLLGINGYHNCFICSGVGRNNKDGIGLSFKDIPTLKEHYARCLYNERRYFEFVNPGEGNTADDGSAIDEFGQTNGVMYKCPVKGCWLQKKTGERGKVCYKVFAIHMASQHGIVEQILEADSRPALQEILKGLKLLDQVKNGIARCRFESCATMQFKADSKRELKLHYAAMHFGSFFKTNPDTGIPPGFTKSGSRAICEHCSEKAGKPVYIQGEREAVVGHLVVKHDVLADILKEAGEKVKEAREVISDIYPDQLTEVYMDTLDKEATPFNEDFMNKIQF